MHNKFKKYSVYIHICVYGASLVAQWERSCLPMRETWVQHLGQQDSLEKEMASPSSTPAWEIPWTEVPGGLQSMGSPESRHNLATEHTANNSESVNSNSIQSDSRVFTYHYHLSTKFYQEVTANQGPQLQKSNYSNYPSDM